MCLDPTPCRSKSEGYRKEEGLSTEGEDSPPFPFGVLGYVSRLLSFGWGLEGSGPSPTDGSLTLPSVPHSLLFTLPELKRVAGR